MLWRLGKTVSPEDALAVETELNIALGGGPDLKEGVAAFFQKRVPAFPDKSSADLPAGVPWWKD